MNLDDFCSNEVPDYTPLGGNRPDCAVVMSVAVSLVDNQQHKPSLSQLLRLPPDVLDTAMAAVCATVIVRSVSEVVPPPRGSYRGGRLSCRLEVVAEASLDEFCFPFYGTHFEENTMPWRRYNNVQLEMALPSSMNSCGHSFLRSCYCLTTLDLRHSTLQTVDNCCLQICSQLIKVYLPDTLHTVGHSFLDSCKSLASIDLRNTKLHTAGNRFLGACESLTEVHLPNTLRTIGDYFLAGCTSLVSIDLHNTMVHKTGRFFLYQCTSLTEVHLPETINSVGPGFLSRCDNVPHQEIERMKERGSKKKRSRNN